MAFKVDTKRQQTMISRIGEAADLIDDKRFLPFYRSVQIKLEKMGRIEEWQNMIDTAKEKNNPSKYFAKMCKMVKDGTYQFKEKLKEIASATKVMISDKIVKFEFGEYQNYWVRKTNEYINTNGNGVAGLIELLEYIERKGHGQKYFAKAILNCKNPVRYYKETVIHNA